MGQVRDSAIASFQEHAGLEPSRGQRLELLERMQQAAFDLIKIIELEISGIRDGDGYWSCSDPVAGLVAELGALERKSRETTIDMPIEDAEPSPFDEPVDEAGAHPF